MKLEEAISEICAHLDSNATIWRDGDGGLYLGHRNGDRAAPRRKYGFQFGPRQVLLYLNNVCDLRCHMCPRTHKPAMRVRNMELALVQSVIDDMSVNHKEATLVFTAYGEPLLYSHLEASILFSSQKGVYSVLCTNGVSLDKEKAESILDAGLGCVFFSVDGVTEGTYVRMRGKNRLNQVRNNIEVFLKIRNSSSVFNKRTKAVVQMILCKETEAEVKDFVNYWYPLLDQNDAVRIKPINTRAGQVKVNKAFKNNASRFASPKKNSFCNQAEQLLVINFDAKTTVCCEDMDIVLNVGKYCGSISKIWEGDKRQSLLNRLRFLAKDSLPNICKQCNEWERYDQWQRDS